MCMMTLYTTVSLSSNFQDPCHATSQTSRLKESCWPKLESEEVEENVNVQFCLFGKVGRVVELCAWAAATSNVDELERVKRQGVMYESDIMM